MRDGLQEVNNLHKNPLLLTKCFMFSERAGGAGGRSALLLKAGQLVNICAASG